MLLPILILTLCSLASVCFIIASLLRCPYCRGWHPEPADEWLCFRRHQPSRSLDSIFDPQTPLRAGGPTTPAANFKPASSAAFADSQTTPSPARMSA